MCLTCRWDLPSSHHPATTLSLFGSGSADEAVATMAIAVDDSGAWLAVRRPAAVGGGSDGGGGTVVSGDWRPVRWSTMAWATSGGRVMCVGPMGLGEVLGETWAELA